NFSYMNALKGEVLLPGLEAEPLQRHSALAKFELSLAVRKQASGQMVCALEFNTDLYREQTAQAMLDDLTATLCWVLDHPAAPLYACGAALTPDRCTPRASPATLHGIFEAQARAIPDAPAVALGDERLSYRQLNEHANQLAAALLDAGIAPGN